MTTAYTSLLGLALPVTGELSGTWGDTVNNYITQYIDASIAGALTVSTDTTLTKTMGAALNSTSSQYAILIASGHVANITITAPAASKEYLVVNTSGSYTVTIRGAGPTTGVVLAANERALVVWNGSDFVKIGGNVLAVSVATANGLAGTSSGGNSPALTLSTTVTGVVKGNGTALSAATAGTDYLAPPSGTAILKANNGAALANAVAGTDYLAPPFGTAILKANSGTGLANAVAGTDYIAPPSGTAILKANSGGALANAVAGTDYIAPPSGTAILKANSGGALANATPGTDYVAPGTATTFTATQTFAGTSSTLSAVLSDAAEPVTISAVAATGTINYDTTTQSVLYYTANASGNWVFNFRASSGTTLNSLLSTGQAITVVFLATNGATPYRPTSIQVDGTTTGVTTRWQGGAAPVAGNANSVDSYTVTIIKTGSATYSVFAAQTAFA